MPKIVLEHVTKRWGDFYGAKDLNFTIEDHEFITLLGPSGCGKTTTLRMIAGLETPTSGRITIGDKVVFDSENGINLSPAKRDVGFLFQNYALWPHMTVYKNIRFGLENIIVETPKVGLDGQPILGPNQDKVNGIKNLLKAEKDPAKKADLTQRLEEAKNEKVVPVTSGRHLTSQEMEERIDEVLKILKITKFRNRYPAELSGGQQQRVAIARTLATKPKVLFMDEPLSNLDAKLRGEMRTELKRLHSTSDCTFIYVTHDQLEAMTLATRICLMNNAVVNQLDAPLTVYRKPANLFSADFVGNPTMNFIPGEIIARKGNDLTVKFLGVTAVYHAKEEINPIAELGDKVVLGIRPEFLPIRENGKLQGLAYSTLPTGMESTVKIDFGGDILSSVVFGSIDYETDAVIHFDIVGDDILVFDAASKKSIALGNVEIKEVVPTVRGEDEEPVASTVELVNKEENPNAEVQEGVLPFKDRTPFEKALAASTIIFMVLSIAIAVVLLFMAGMNAAADTKTLDAMLKEMNLQPTDENYVIVQAAVLARATTQLVFAIIVAVGAVVCGFINRHINKPRRGFVKGLILSILGIVTFQVVPGILLLISTIRSKKAK